MPPKDQFRYLPAAPRDRLWGIVVTAAGSQCVAPGERFQAAGHSPSHDYLWRRGRVIDEYAVVYVTAGRGEFESKVTGRTPIAAGECLLIFPGVWHRYRHDAASGWDTLWATFQGDLPDRLVKDAVFGPGEPLLHPGLDEAVLRPFQNLWDHVRARPAGLMPLLAADMLGILAGLSSAVERKAAGGSRNEAVRKAKALIEAAECAPTIGELADAAGLGRSRFHEIFKDVAGISPRQYHLQLRISRAKELLRGSDLSVKQIAAVLRFSSVYQFSRMFSRKTGLSPSRYRQRSWRSQPGR